MNIQLERTQPYEMLDPDQRVAFFDVMVALLQKAMAGEIKTVHMGKDFVGHAALEDAQSQVALLL